MTPYKQLNRHDPDKGVIGDCWRTAIACLLDMHPREVPHFCDGANFHDVAAATAMLREWLAPLGMGIVELPYTGELDAVLGTISHFNPNTYYLLAGTSRNGTGHVVVVRDGCIVWDPAIDDSGIVGPAESGHYWVSFLVHSSMVKR